MNSLEEPDGSPSVVGPLDPLVVPRYAGPSTFARLPTRDEVSSYDVAILGVPFDSGTTYRTGARFGPAAVRQASRLLRPFHPTLGVRPFQVQQVVDAGDIACTPFSISQAFEQITTEAARVVADGARFLCIGGDHSISLPLIRACSSRHGKLGFIHFDAHLDTFDSYFGEKYAHGSPFRRAVEEGLLDTTRCMHVGIRGPVYDESDFSEDVNLGFSTITTDDIWKHGMSETIEGVRNIALNGAIYVSVDIDVLDPSAAPGTGTPEAGGLLSRELLALIQSLRGSKVVGADVVEVNPAFDHAEMTAISASRIIYDLLCVFAPGQT